MTTDEWNPFFIFLSFAIRKRPNQLAHVEKIEAAGVVQRNKMPNGDFYSFIFF